jgi:hypothetical protein
MTPQNKAEELYNKFLSELPHPETTNAAVYSIAKQCALLSIDERIDEMYAWMGGGGIEWEKDRFKYWEEVKKEIEKI